MGTRGTGDAADLVAGAQKRPVWQSRADGAVGVGIRSPRVAVDVPANARGAIIIPAHNEAAVIACTLESIAPLTALDSIEVIVVCNGCTDSTADVVRRVGGVQIVELGEGSKTKALNAGDAAATQWPRLYLDADIEAEPQTVLAVFDALGEPGVLAARAWYAYDVTGASWPVRAYYRARARIPAPARRLWGAGGYAVSEEGHARMGAFPPVTADDSWFDEQFSAHEKRVVPSSPMLVRTPRDTRALGAVLMRQRRGYVEIGVPSQGRSRARGLLMSIRGPLSAADAACYLVLTLWSRACARRAAKVGGQRWERDASSR